MSKAYAEAVEQADVLFDIPSTTPEHLVALGYRAGLTDAVVAAKEVRVEHDRLKEESLFGAATRGKLTAKRIFLDKLASLARKSETRAKELKV